MSAFDMVAVTMAATSDPDNNVFAEGNITAVPSGTHWPDGQGGVIVPPVLHGTLLAGTCTLDLIASDNFDAGVLAWDFVINIRGMETISAAGVPVYFSEGASQSVWDILDAAGDIGTPATSTRGAYLPLDGGTLTGELSPAVAPLTFGASIAVNAALGNVFAVTLTASTGTLANPTNPVDGQAIRFRVIQDGTGGWTLSYDTAYDFGAAGAPTLSTDASKVDILGFEYVASLSKWCYLGSGLGF